MSDRAGRDLHRLGAAGLVLALLAAAPLLLGAPGRSAGAEPPMAAPASGPLPAAALAAPESCGRSGCHPDIAAQWAASAHRSSGLDDPWYRAALGHTRQSAGEVPARWCAGCHTPALPAAAGAGSPAPAAAGVSCAACHPDAHRPAGAAAPAAATCARCHQGSADASVNGFRALRLFDDTRAWQPGNDANPGGIRLVWQPRPCLDCHMPRVRSADAGSRGGEVHSHRFAAANTALPALQKDGEQLRAVTEFLEQGQVTIDLFALARSRGAAASGPDRPEGGEDEVEAPLDRLAAAVRRGESVRFDVVVQARGLGHRFPGGKDDLSDCWLEVKATDDRGRVVFWSGRAEAGSAVDPDAHFLRTVWADDQGGRVERYEVWRARLAAYRQLFEPGAAHVARYRVEVPRDAGTRLTVTARLNYRKVAWDFHRWAFAQLRQPLPELPIVTLAASTVTLAVVDAGAALPDRTRPAPQPNIDAERWNAYGLGLGMAGDFPASRHAFEQALALAPASAPAALGLSLSVPSLPQAIELLEKAVAFDPKLASAHSFLGGAEREATHYAEALAEQRIARDLAPGDLAVQRDLGATLLLAGDSAAAIRELAPVAAAEPENADLHLSLRQAYRAAGDTGGAERELQLYERTREDPATPEWRRRYLAAHPADAREQQGVHEHLSTSPRDAGPQPPSGAADEIRFVDVTAASGVRWVHNTGAFGQAWLPETLGPGVIVLDADGDGRPDLLFVNGRNFPGKPGEATRPALYLNEGGMQFRDATREAGLDWSAYCLGGAAADFDNDGDADLYLACVGRDLLLRNDGGRFVDVSQQAGLAQEEALGAAAVFLDADRDGFLDLYVTRYVTWSPEKDLFCGGDGNAKSYCTAAVYPGASPRFYHNRGDGTFEDRTRAAGLYNPDAKALGSVALDFDGDGWPDLAVACDTAPNLLYRNRGDGTFEELGALAGVAASPTGRIRGGMGISAGDYDHSSLPSLAVTNFANEMIGLYQNQGDRFFRDLAPGTEVGRSSYPRLGWGCLFFDYDLDGWLDLLTVNGPLDPRRRAGEPESRYAEPELLFRNRGKGVLVDVTATAGGDLARPLVGRGAAFVDLDGDGDLDVVVTTNGGPAKIFENRGGHGNWLRVTLRGEPSNRGGLGARVEVTAGGSTQSWQVHTGGSYLSQSQTDPTFGLGDARSVDRVVVRWPSGKVSVIQGMEANRQLIVAEGRVGPEPDHGAKSSIP